MISVDFNDCALSSLPDELQGVLNYWRVLCGERIAPAWKEFDMLEIPSKHLRMTMVKDVEENPRMYRYRFYGSQLAILNRGDVTGLTTDDINFSVLASAVRQSLDEFVEQRQPRYYRLDFVDKYDRETAQFLLRLPISNDGKTVTNVVSIVFYHLDKDLYHRLIAEADGGAE